MQGHFIEVTVHHSENSIYVTISEGSIMITATE